MIYICVYKKNITNIFLPEGLIALDWWAGVLVASMGVPGVEPGGWIMGVPRE